MSSRKRTWFIRHKTNTFAHEIFFLHEKVSLYHYCAIIIPYLPGSKRIKYNDTISFFTKMYHQCITIWGQSIIILACEAKFQPVFLQSDSYLRLVFLLTSSVALTTLSVRTFSPSVTVTIGEFTRVPDLWAMSALALGIDCPSSGLPSNARMRTDLQRHERWRRKARHKCGAAYCREKHPKWTKIKPLGCVRSHAKNADTSTLNRDTLMIHFLAFLQEVSFFQTPIHQRIMPFSTPKDDTMILFRQKHFTCVRKWYFKECKKEGRFQHFF